MCGDDALPGPETTAFISAVADMDSAQRLRALKIVLANMIADDWIEGADQRRLGREISETLDADCEKCARTKTLALRVRTAHSGVRTLQ